MTTTVPTPIADGTPAINEAELNNYSPWQREMRRRQLEAAAQKALDEQKREAAESERKLKRVKELLDVLAKCGITIPDSAEVNTADIEPVIIYGGYEWSFVAPVNNFGSRIQIEKPIKDALTVDQLDNINQEWWDTDYRLAVSTRVYPRAENIADALDDIDAEAERQRIANESALAAIKEAAAASPNAVPEPATITTTRTVQHYDVILTTDAETLQKYLDDGWTIAFEQFVVQDGETCHAVRLEKEVAEPAPTPEKIKAEAEANTDDALSKFDEALLEIIGDDDDEPEAPETPEETAVPETVGVCYSTPEDDPEIIYHVDEQSSALDTLLAGKPIAQAIAKHGMEATKAALNAKIVQKMLGVGNADDAHYQPLDIFRGVGTMPALSEGGES